MKYGAQYFDIRFSEEITSNTLSSSPISNQSSDFSMPVNEIPQTRKLNIHVCEFCNATFTRKENFISHVGEHTGQRPFVCSVCNKSFARKDYLVKHFMIHTGERPYKCLYCPYSSNQSHAVRRHCYVKHMKE